MKHKFDVALTVHVELELDSAVIDAVDDEWRKELYDLRTPEEIAKHIAYNMVVNSCKLSEIEGWADQPDSNAKITNDFWEIESEKAI